EQLFGFAAFGAHHSAGGEGDRFRLPVLDIVPEAGDHSLVHGNVVEGAEIVLQIGEAILVPGQRLLAGMTAKQALEEVNAVAQLLHGDAQLVAIMNAELADVLAALLGLGNTAGEQLPGKWLDLAVAKRRAEF